MKKLFLTLAIVFALMACGLVSGCGKTTNSLIYTESSNIASTVYITEYGNFYHYSDCRTIKNSQKTAIRRIEAEEKGYTPCSVCFY